jgi:hypothetical protein
MTRKDDIALLAMNALMLRRERMRDLPSELFSEPAWDLLLELFVADHRGYRLTARDVSDRSNTPTSVMGRWLLHLTKIGLVIGDGSGDVDDLLTLSPIGMESMEKSLARTVDSQVDLDLLQ